MDRLESAGILLFRVAGGVPEVLAWAAEVDRAEWFDPAEARRKINPAQAAFVDRLCRVVRSDG